MDVLLRILLALLYPFLLLARPFRPLGRGDRLRLRRPRDTASYWVERSSNGESGWYFSEASFAEGAPQVGTVRLMTRALLLLARVYAPARSSEEREYIAAADREQGIPDEVYTLW